MKRKLNLFLSIVCMLLIIFLVNVCTKFYKPYTTQKTGSATSGPSSGINRTIDDTSLNSNNSNPDSDNKDTITSDTTSAEQENNAVSDKTAESDNTTPSDKPAASEDAPASGNRFTEKASASLLTRDALRQLSAGTVIDVKEPGDTLMNNCFYYEDIKDDIKSRIVRKSYKEDCTVPLGDLKYVRILYYGFDKETYIGELIVNKTIAADIVDIFAELYEEEYPIEQMVLVDEYDADDNASMAANNTSSFNYRTVSGSTHLSKHALGLAIDINPLYNPYVQYMKEGAIILPVEGSIYADRTLDCPYYITEDNLCYRAFAKRGFTWGGFWETEPDYQHFQKTIE